MAKKWYVIQTYSGYEAKVRDALQQRVKQSTSRRVRRDPDPERDGDENRAGGKTRVRQKRSLPGYIFVEMEMSEKVWHLVKDTPKVTGFIGNQTPQEVPIPQIENLRAASSRAPSSRSRACTFEIGEEVRVARRRVRELHGTVDDVKMDKQKLKVEVSIFGRPTQRRAGLRSGRKTSITMRRKRRTPGRRQARIHEAPTSGANLSRDGNRHSELGAAADR